MELLGEVLAAHPGHVKARIQRGLAYMWMGAFGARHADRMIKHYTELSRQPIGTTEEGDNAIHDIEVWVGQRDLHNTQLRMRSGGPDPGTRTRHRQPRACKISGAVTDGCAGILPGEEMRGASLIYPFKDGMGRKKKERRTGLHGVVVLGKQTKRQERRRRESSLWAAGLITHIVISRLFICPRRLQSLSHHLCSSRPSQTPQRPPAPSRSRAPVPTVPSLPP